jgi:hypothetical protein
MFSKKFTVGALAGKKRAVGSRIENFGGRLLSIRL